MGKFTLKDAWVRVDGHVISNHVHEVTVTTERDVQDATGMGAKNKEKRLGLGDGMIELAIWSDMASGSIDSILWPISQSDTAVKVEVRATSASPGTSNPQYEMDALLANYSPLDGKVGDTSSTKVKFENSGAAGLTRHDGSS